MQDLTCVTKVSFRSDSAFPPVLASAADLFQSSLCRFCLHRWTFGGKTATFGGYRGYFISRRGVELSPKAGVVQKYFKLATAVHFLDIH